VEEKEIVVPAGRVEDEKCGSWDLEVSPRYFRGPVRRPRAGGRAVRGKGGLSPPPKGGEREFVGAQNSSDKRERDKTPVGEEGAAREAGGDARQGWHGGGVHAGEEVGGERDRGLHVGEEEGRDRSQGRAGRGGVYVDELKRVLYNRASVPRDFRYVPAID
jgi:hypothetical protein